MKRYLGDQRAGTGRTGWTRAARCAPGMRAGLVLLLLLSLPGLVSAQLPPGKVDITEGRTIIGEMPWMPPEPFSEKVIYGDDDRIDVYQETDPTRLALTASVCGLTSATRLTNNGNGTFSLVTSAYTVSGRPACAGEPFGDQPTVMWCTGFLVGDDLIATAGHCYNDSDIATARFVFGFSMLDATTPVTTVQANQVYEGVEVVGWALGGGLDYAVVRVDRPVNAPGAIPLDIRRTGTIANGTPVGMIGHPAGLPMKIAYGDQTLVRNNFPSGYFVANLDAYGGNSGSPVFNQATGVVEGILVRGATDYQIVGTCFVSNQLADTQGGEDVSKTVTFAQFIPELPQSAGEVTLDKPAYPCNGSLGILVADTDLVAGPTVTVTTAGGDTENVTLAPQIPGRFSGTILIAQGAPSPNNGVVEVMPGDVITVTYFDADDGTGNPAIAQATAPLDCAPPVISNVNFSEIGGHRITVNFQTNEPAVASVTASTGCGLPGSTVNTSAFATQHSVMVTGLEPLTEYFVLVQATDAAGNTALDDNQGLCYSAVTADSESYFTQQFSGNFDLDGVTLLFTPAANASGYTLCKRTASFFPTDPTGGTTLALPDDGSEEITLASGAQVALYGVSYGSFYAGSNGYLTFDSPDSAWSASLLTHFNRPRVSMLFTDLNPAAGGMVSWKQRSDRVAITYENVPRFAQTDSNSFQAELFFDGRIALTYLGVDAVSAIVGLSRGLGTPQDFAPEDLSACDTCGTGSGGDQPGIEFLPVADWRMQLLLAGLVLTLGMAMLRARPARGASRP